MDPSTSTTHQPAAPRFYRTRLAPSPTGHLHLGHARTFLITWWLAQQHRADVVLRMDDLDATRVTPEIFSRVLADLRWLGITWNEGETGQPPAAGEESFRQSQRRDVYTLLLNLLWKSGAIYPCTCTREEIAAAIAAPHEGELSARYPGTCLGRYASFDDAIARAGHACWRLKTRPGVVPFTDLIAGPQGFDIAASAGDVPLTRLDGTPSYQLACVADDAAMAIDLVVRGDDLLESASQQMLLFSAMGLAPPTFAHVPLVVGGDGRRLAKRAGESRLSRLRDLGVPPERVVGWVAWRSGMLKTPEELTAREAITLFDLARLPRQRITLTDEDNAFLQGHR